MMENIKIKVFNQDNAVADDELQSFVDLYKEHPEFDENERKNRGISSIESLKERIREKVSFVLAVDETSGEVVGGSVLDFSENRDLGYKESKISTFLHNALFVKSEFRGNKIGEKIMGKVDEIVRISRKSIGESVLQCGIDIENLKSKEFHKKMGWSHAEAEAPAHWEGKYELWEK